MAGTSRVNREVYARFCGRLEVKSLRPTRRRDFRRWRAEQEAIRLEHQIISRRDDVDDIRQWQFAIGQFLDRKTGFPRQDFGHQAAMGGRHVLSDDVDAAKVGEQPRNELAQCFQTAGRSPDTHHGRLIVELDIHGDPAGRHRISCMIDLISVHYSPCRLKGIMS